MATFGGWREEDDLKEEPINIDELLHTTAGQGRTANTSVQSQAPSAGSDATTQNLLMNQQAAAQASYLLAQQQQQQQQKVPTFSGSANRPSVLDLSTTAVVKAEYADGNPHTNMNGHSPHQQRAPSPHHQQPSPHGPHQRSYGSEQQVFNYNNTGQTDQPSPMSPHAPQQVSRG